jgi:hypothetical protein
MTSSSEETTVKTSQVLAVIRSKKCSMSKRKKLALTAGSDVVPKEMNLPRHIFRCRPKSLVTLINGLDDIKRKAIEEIGFGGLLHLKLTNFPKPIFPLFVKSFGKGDHYFGIHGGKSFLLSKLDVCDVFQLPCGPNSLPLLGTARCKESTQSEAIEMKRAFKARFGVYGVKKGVMAGNLLARLSSQEIGLDEFKELFVLFAVSTFLAPTTNGSIDLALLRAVQDVGSIGTYDWCSHIFQNAVDGFKSAVDGAQNIVGCSPFVYIAYFHRFNYKGEVSPSTLPLIQHWTDERLEARAKSETASGALGRAPPSDVHYPLSCRRGIYLSFFNS